MRFARQRRSWSPSHGDTLAAGGQRRSSNLVVTAETALDAEPGIHRLAAGLVGTGGAARGAHDARDADAVRDHEPGDRQRADGDVRCVRLLRDAGACHLRRRMARQARRARGAGAGRKRAADDRHAGQLLDAAGGDRHRAGCVHGVLRRRRRSQRGVGRNRSLAALRAAGRVAGHGQHDPRPSGRVAAGFGRRYRRGAAAVAAQPRRPAQARSRQAGLRTRGRARGDAARRCSSRAAGGMYRGQARPAGAVHRNAVPADRAWRRRPGARQRGRAARMVHVAGSRQRARAQRPV